MFSFLFRAVFWLALVYYLVPFDALFGTQSHVPTPSSLFGATRAETASDTRSVTTSTILVRPDGRTIRVSAAPEPRTEVAEAAPVAADPRPSVSDVVGFCGRNPRVCDYGLIVVQGAASRAGDALEALGALVKPDAPPQPRRHTAAAGHDTLTDSDREIAPGRSAIP